MKKMMKRVMVLTVVLMGVTSALFAEGAAQAVDYNTAVVCIAAALAFAVGALAAGGAIGKVGSAAMGAISERPEIASQALIFIALAEGLVVFGFITALMILGKV